MLQGEKILITGPAGQIAFPLTKYLAESNEVWGVARFSEPGSREKVDALGVTTRVIDLAIGDYSSLPDDFTYVLHLAAFKVEGLDYDWALTVNAEGTGLLLQHCRKAKAALIMSTQSVYKPIDDPWHAFRETDPLGDVNYVMSPTYSISKISEEAVARYCARAFNLPVTIARMNASYGPNGGLPTYQMDWMAADQPIIARWDPAPYSIIHQDDINEQTESLLQAASVPATVVNWGGDETPTVEEWCRYIGELTGKTPNMQIKPIPNTLRGSIADNTKRLSLTGPCKVSWRDGIRRTLEHRYPSGVSGAEVQGQASRLLGQYKAVVDKED
jgi:nucleoside-diphosphate-sugar epimerase